MSFEEEVTMTIKTDDERLLSGELRRALGRLLMIRAKLDELRSETMINPEAYNELVKLTREENG